MAIAPLLFGSCSKNPAELKAGAILTLSGDAAAYGQSAKNAMQLALDEINAREEFPGRKLLLIYEDDQLDPKTGVTAFQKLTAIDKVPVVLGPLTSSVALAIAPIANRKRVVLLSPSASSPNITTAGDYIFRNVASDEYETLVMARYARDSLKLRHVGILYINNDFGAGYKQFFTTFFTRRGGVVTTEAYEQGATSYRTQLEKLTAAGVDAVYLIGYKEMGRVLRQASELRMKSQFLSYSAVEDPDVVNQAGTAGDGLIYTRQSFDPDDPDSIVNHFASAYRKAYGSPPDPYAALSYDAVNILAKAIRTGGWSSDGIKRALYATHDFPGVTGTTSFDANGDVAKSISIKRISGTSFQYIAKNVLSR
jgi:branched-chain amino acid transport system substrate-binding protein